MRIHIKYGLFAAATSIAWTLTGYITGLDRMDSYKYFGWFSILIPAFFIYKGIKEKRDIEQNGFITYGKAFNLGMLISLFYGLIYTVFCFFYFNWINPGIIDFQFQKQMETMQEKGMDEAQMEQAMKMTEKFMNPTAFTITSFLMILLIGILISLILPAILKKEDPEEIS